MSTRDVWLNVKHLATFLYQGFIEVDEESPLLLIEGAEIILQIFKEGRIEVTCLQSVPMLPLPGVVCADAHIFHQAFSLHEIAAVYRNGKVQRAIRGINRAAIANSLLMVVLVLFNENWLARHKADEPTDRW